MKKIVFLLLLVVFLSACNLNKAPDEPKKNLLLNATDKDVVSDLTYNELLSYKLEPSNTPGYYKTGQEGKIIEWSAKISKHYSQITGIKFCVLDNNHQNVDITKPCDMFWAFSDNLMDADNLVVNPDWNGNWVPYILNYYNVSFDENTDYYNDVYTVKGVINGIDCAPTDKCSPDIEIIDIKK